MVTKSLGWTPSSRNRCGGERLYHCPIYGGKANDLSEMTSWMEDHSSILSGGSSHGRHPGSAPNATLNVETRRRHMCGRPRLGIPKRHRATVFGREFRARDFCTTIRVAHHY